MDQLQLFAVTNAGTALPFTAKQDGAWTSFTLKKETFQDTASLRIGEALTETAAGAPGWYLLPRNVGMEGDVLTRFVPRENGEYRVAKPLLSLFGVKKPGLCALVRIRRDYRYTLEVTLNEGVYRLAMVLDFSEENIPAEDLHLEILLLPETAGYAEMAAAERERRLALGEIRTLREKCAQEAADYARKYPLIRIRMGWKPSPSPVDEQTPENEPEMFAACSFARVRDIADALRRHGVEGAELQLVGWNKSGHDGRYPQLFPVEERLGGEEELKKTIAYVKSLNYRISLHTNCIDAYTVANTFTWDDITVKRDGSYLQIGHYSGGLAYRVCLKKQLKNAMRELPRVAALKPNGLHFIDVISIVEPDVCHAPDHAVTEREAIEIAQKIMAYARAQFGGFSSEGCMDFAMHDLDYGLYVTFGNSFEKNSHPFHDAVLPFWELVYHSVVLYNPDSSTINYAIKTPAERLRMVMRGGRPSFYYYSKFRTGGHVNWMGETDLTAGTAEELEQSAAVISAACRAYAPLADRQLIPMTDYQIRPGGLQIAFYADGARIAGNFSDQAQDYEGHTVPAWGYVTL